MAPPSAEVPVPLFDGDSRRSEGRQSPTVCDVARGKPASQHPAGLCRPDCRNGVSGVVATAFMNHEDKGERAVQRSVKTDSEESLRSLRVQTTVLRPWPSSCDEPDRLSR